MKYSKRLSLLCIAALIAGCTSQATPSLPGTNTMNAPSATQRQRSGKGHLVLKIRIPKKHHHHRRSKFISPATRSMSVSISGPTVVNETINLTPTSTGCTSTLTSTLCELSLALAAGSYTANVTTYDATGGAGNKLSTAQGFAFNVVAGTSNAVNMTLSGIPASIVVLSASAYSRTNASGGIDLYGTANNKLLVEALDADGNLILGAGAPTAYAISQAFGNLALTITAPVSTSPNTFYVKPPSSYSGETATLSVQAQYTGAGVTDGCAQTGANCFTNVQFDMKQLLAVAQGTSVLVYQSDENTPLATISSLSGANAVAFDSTGNLYIAAGSSVKVYDPPFASQKFAITSGVNGANAVVFDSSGNLFVSDCATGCGGAGTDEITKYTPPLSSSSSAALTISTGISEPVAIIEDPSDNLFVANLTGSGTGSVTEYATAYTSGAPTSTITNTVTSPNALVYESRTPSIFVSMTGGGVEQYTLPCSGCAPSGALLTTSGGQTGCPTNGTTILDHPVALAANGPLNRIFVANSSAGTVNAVTAYRISSFSCRGVIDSGGNPAALAIDGSANLYVADNSANTVSIFNSLTTQPPVLQNTLSGFTAPVGLATAP